MNREPSSEPTARSGWRLDWQLAALVLLVAVAYFTRLAVLPVCGEESRWASAAREMIATGDWIVPRQQGTIFPERPPLGSWAMALVGLVRGEVDLVAVRLPSALATLAVVVLIYSYARSWITPLGSLAAAAIYATGGQVLQLGRAGESEALFTLFTAGALLSWHWGYLRGRSQALTWSLGYTLAALGALVKGPQAPVYFVGATVVYLALRRDWTWLFSRAHAVGVAAFAAIVCAWLVPFTLSNTASLDDIWLGLAGDRFTTDGLAKHMLAYPFEILGCLLPWSPLLGAYLLPGVRRTIWQSRGELKFLLVALAVSFPTVWLAAGARGRYYMPLYPCLAVLMGLVVEHCAAQASAQLDKLYWRRFQRVVAVVILAAGGALVIGTLVPDGFLGETAQPATFLAIWVAAALACAGLLAWASLKETLPRPQVGVLALAGFLALAAAGPMINARVRAANDLAPEVAELRERLDRGELVSLGRVYHRFAYSYAAPIRQVPWPEAVVDLPDDVTYFCFDWRPCDTPESRARSDGRELGTTSGTLPFEWEEVARIECDPTERKVHNRTVIVGRVRRPLVAARPATGIRTASRPALQR
jgi:4-amino-4-deoxy-L-arabinose transferase-like glycosyltransferase